MKFSNGYWLPKDGFQIHSAAQAHDIEVEENALSVFATSRVIRDRGDTLGGVVLNARYSAPMENVIKVRISHFEGGADGKVHFELNEEKNVSPKIEVFEKCAKLTSGNLTVNIERSDRWNVEFTDANGSVVTKCESRSTAYALKKTHPEEHLFGKDEIPYIKEELTLGIGECVYGLGERFGTFIKNGQSVDIYNADGGTASEQSYKNVPFYLTNKGYGIFVNDAAPVSFEIASEKVSRVQFSTQGECLEYFVIYGPTPKEILERYTALTGRPALVPDWTLGLWLSTSFTTNYDEKTVMNFIDGMFERKIPLSVFHFDCFWMRGYHWCDFIWDKDTFPDPAGLIKRLHEKGLKVCVWINPYIAQRSALFAEGKEKGFFIKKADGGIFQTDFWQSGMAIVDFTNPDAKKWYQQKLQALVDMGVDCFKTDFGERIPDDGVYFNNADSVRMHNFYTYLYNQSVFELLEKNYGKDNAVLFARSATAGGQKFPVHWGGDCESSFESMAESLRGGLSLTLSGFGFWSHDIGGFEGNPPPAVFKRWLQFGLLSSHSRLHGSHSYRVPWSVDEESCEVAKKFTEIKLALKSYLMDKVREAHERGVPVMRAMLLEFPGDPACLTLDRQYMLGEKYLVAPIFTQEGDVTYYIPKGKWRHYIDGRELDLECGKWLSEKYDFMSLPLWEKIG